MAKQENIKIEGIITADLSNGIFEVSMIDREGEFTGHVAKGTIGSKLRMNNIRLCVQDRVVLEVSPYDLTLGRIVYRYNVNPDGTVQPRREKGSGNDRRGKKKR